METSEPVHFTHLKRMSDSPAHYLASLEENRDSAAFHFGRLVHYLILGGVYDYAVWTGKRRAGKVWEAFEEANEGRDIFTKNDLDHAMRITKAVKTDRLAQPFLEGEREKLIEWSFLNRKCQSRLDVLGDHVVEVKTTQCSKPEKFRWDVDRYAYHAQLAFYRDAARYIGRPTRGAIIIAVEKELPYAVTVCRLSDALLEEGAKLNRLWMERLLSCERANEWPAYTQSIEEYDVRRQEGVTLIIGGEEVAA